MDILKIPDSKRGNRPNVQIIKRLVKTILRDFAAGLFYLDSCHSRKLKCPTFAAQNCGCGEIGRRTRLRIWRREAWGFESLRPHIFSGSWLLVHGSWFMVVGSWLWVLSSWFLVVGAIMVFN